jgi:methyltransferase (TIGR00027 family)
MAEMKQSRTAFGVAWMRAAHQVLDSQPLILEDEPILDLLGRDYVERMRKEPARMQIPAVRLLRSHVVLRSRFTEDRLAESLARGVRQFVILGAGYDTFFARQPAWAKALKVFEIDQPATQEDKLARIAAARMSVPPNVTFGSVNFEAESLIDGLNRHGVDFDVPTVFSWLGVTMYLTEPAIDATLRTVLSFAGGSEIVLTFASRDSQPITYAPGSTGSRLSTAEAQSPSAPIIATAPANPAGIAAAVPADTDPTGPPIAAMAAALGEPWLTYYEPDEIERKLRHLGFRGVELLTPEKSEPRYFAGRTDGLPPPRRTSIVSAIV